MILGGSISCHRSPVSKSNKVLHLALTSEVSTLDPALSYDNVSGAIIYNVYEQLYEYQYLNRPYELIPLLAEGQPRVEDGGKKYIIKIKKNIFYHAHPKLKPDRTVEAQDFINAIKRLCFKPINSSGWWLVDNVIKGTNEFREKAGDKLENITKFEISGLKALDSHTLSIELVNPSPQFLYRLSLSFVVPTPYEVLGTDLEKDLQHEFGTGPFYLEKLTKEKITLQKFKLYRDSFYPSVGDRIANNRGFLKDAGEKIPFIETIQYYVIKNNQERFEKFIKEEIDILPLTQDLYQDAFNELGNIKDFLRSKNIRLQASPTLTYWWLAFNMQDPIVGKNVHLRMAIAHAINFNEYIQKFTKSTGQVANSILPPGIFGYNPSSQLPFSYHPEKAKSFLKMAGYPEGKGLPTITFDTRSATELSYKQALFFQSELKKIGIKLEIRRNNFNVFLEKGKKGELQFFQDGWTLDFPDAENALLLLQSNNFPPGPNASFYSNPKFDQLYKKIQQIKDGDEKKKYLKEVEAIFNQDFPWIMQYYSRNFVLYHERVKNFRPSDLIWSYPKYIHLK